MGKITQALNLREIMDLVRDDLKRVEQEIRLESVGSVSAITAISNHMQAAGGKRLRPILLLLSTRLTGDISDEAIRLAAVMEMIHTATLVHDDVIDMADTRRGRPSANAVFGNQVSVLAGDWLYMQAFHVALRLREFRVLDILIGLTQLMVEGELIQLDRIGKIDLTEADYMELVDRKTAALFASCAQLGGVVARA
ncbi:MAG: polyprenyl synthetase family protein, partial [Bryobacteraceae bacterium]|nr:polyprenyl synthetase family protein [Bryobacteraceae bacterium]